VKKSDLKKLIKEVITEVMVELSDFGDEAILNTNKGKYRFGAMEEREEDNKKWMYIIQKIGDSRQIDVPSQVAPTYTANPMSKEIQDSVIRWIEAGMPELGLYDKWYIKNEKPVPRAKWLDIAKNA
jgi:hypothetical protein